MSKSLKEGLKQGRTLQEGDQSIYIQKKVNQYNSRILKLVMFTINLNNQYIPFSTFIQGREVDPKVEVHVSYTISLSL